MTRFAAVALLLIFALALASGPGRADAETLRFRQDGLSRRAELYIPTNLTAPAPLVMVLHGVLETGAKMQHITRDRFEALADTHGFIVVHATAYLRIWHLGIGSGAARLRPYRDDITYLDTLLATAKSRAPVDEARVYFAGFSQGGIMSYAYACNHPGKVRAISVTSMGLPLLLAEDCAAHPPEGVQLIHGTKDLIVPFEGGDVPSGPGVMMRLLGHDKTVDFFAHRLGCTGAPRQTLLDAKRDQTRVTLRDWPACARGALRAYRIDGGGHKWPSGGPELPFTGRATQEFDGAEAAWNFFLQFQ